MVAVVTGNGLGLFNTSLNILGAAGSFGQGNLGQAGGKAWVNASTGNLILRFTDEQLSGQGQDLFHTRTYNTLGALNDADGDGWRWDGERRVVLAGTALTAGSSLTRTTGDGHETVYTWNGSRYQSTDGDGAHDFIQWDGQNNEWYWTDGTTRSVERYNGSSGLLVSLRDTQGTLITYGYHNGKLSSVTDSSGQALLMVYNDAGQMIRLDTRSSANGPLTSQVYYVYDGYGRLLEVKTDLTPDDNSIADGQYYFTRYTYDGSSFRVATVEQSDRTSASFTYEWVDGQYRVKTVNDASGLTTFTYVPSQRYTKVSNALNQEWVYTYDAKGQLTYVQSPAENGQSFYTGYQYDADGNVTRVTDNSGNAVSYFYDARGNRILERDPKGVTVARTFNAANQLLSEIHYSQPATWYAASGTWGEPPASSAQVTRYVYDYAERLRFVVSATGGVVEYTYEARGLRAQEIVHGAGRYPVAGLAPNTTLDESALAAWSAAQDHGKTRLTAFNYDYRGNLILRVAYANVDSNGNWLLDSAAELTRYVYNEQGQLLQTLAGRGADRSTQVLLSSTAYDGMGRVIAQMDASGTRTTLYDDQERRIAVTTASGLVLTQVYDPLGRLMRIEESTTAGNARGNTEYAYDAAGRLIMKKDATGVRTYTFYDALGRVAADVDGTGSITRYGYNQKDQRISALSYATQVDTRAWFNNGVVSVTLAQILPAASAADRLTRLDYDEAGRLLNSVDAVGTVTSYEYDGRGQLVRQATGQRVTRFFFDADGRQVGQLDAEGYLRENVYNAAGQLQQVIRYAAATTVGMRATGSLTDLRPNGASLSTWSFYDGAGRQIGSVDEQGFVSETVYNEAGNASQSIRYLSAYTATLSAGTSFATVRATAVVGGSEATITVYDALGRLSRRVMVDGTVTTFEYDAAGRLVKETTAAGTADERSTRTLYDAFGQTTGKLLGEASGRITAGMSQAQIAAVYSQYGSTWNYDAAGRVASVTDALGNRTVSYYDAAGRLTRVINAVGEVSETKYNAFGDAIEKNQLSNRVAPGTLPGLAGGLQNSGLEPLLAAIRNANNDSRTSATYDTRGLLLTSIDAEGISTTNQYDAFGQLQRQIRVIAGSRTVTSAYGYNLRGERISQTRDAGGLNLTNTTAYDAFGRVIRSTDAAGNVTSSEYQNNGRTVVVRDPLSNSRRTELDAFGRTLESVDALGNVTTYSYDDINRSVVVTMPDGTQVSTWKTRHGETLKVVNGKGDTTRYEYNRDGQLTRTIDALGQVEVKRYDRAGRLSESVDARGIVTHLDYDAANRVVQRSVDPTGLNQRTTYEFDTSGRQIRVVDAAGSSSARVTENRYDRKGQLVQTVVDPNGLQLSTRYSYDGLGNVLRTSQGTVSNPEQRITDYVYNTAGQRRFSIDALGYVSERTYDAAGNVVQEIRYANRYAGARDAVALQVLGVSGVINPSFANAGTSGVPEGWTLSSVQAAGAAMVGGETLSLFQSGRSPEAASFVDLTQDIPKVQAGQRYAFSAFTAVQGADAWVGIIWYDANGKIINWTSEDASSLNRFDANVGLNAFKRTVTEGIAPTGAVSAQLVIRKKNTLSGQGESQLLAMSPEFKVLPVLASTDDRVTSYVYDALGRQRFSIDALGYVSERSYDATGNVVEEVRYANKYTGARDAATLRALGVSGVKNPSFANSGSSGVPEGWSLSNVQAAGAAMVGGETVSLFQSGRGTIAPVFVDLVQDIPKIQAGQRYAFSAYTAVQGADAWVGIIWLNASGGVISWTSDTGASQNPFDASIGLNAFKRTVGEGVAPPGAVSAQLVIRKKNTQSGYSDSQLLAAGPEFKVLPVQASAYDRVTSYVYDALGRQRFSVDALGYVSERSYDATGNVVEEVRYANKLQGPRDTATLKVLGVSGVKNPAFANAAANGVPQGWTLSNVQAAGAAMVGGETVSLFQSGRGTIAPVFVDLTQDIPKVQAGQRYAFSAYTAVQGADAWVGIVWRDANGGVISWTSDEGASQNRFDANVGLNAFKRTVGEGIAPPGAVSAQLVIRKKNTLADQSDSQLLAMSPEFKALPVLASTDDRVTSYAYDALGRQRFSIDALGYVSERSYDAAGNVVEEIRYANPLQGPRDAATLRALGASGKNPTFANPGANGVPEGWALSNVQAAGAAMVDGETVSLFQSGRGSVDPVFVDLTQDIPKVQGGQRYAFSAYTAVQGADAWVGIVWYDASGKIINWTSDGESSLNRFDASVGLNAFTRIVAEGVAPPGAVSAQLVIRKKNTLPGLNDSQLLAMNPQFRALPVQASADDRVTSYVYDALNRQRFSIDALGYVSERSYDAAGNVVEEIRYANKLLGPRDTARLKALGVSVVRNPSFANAAANGVPQGWSLNSVHAAGAAMVGGETVSLFQSGSGTIAPVFVDLTQDIPKVQAGQRYTFSAYTAVQGADAWVGIVWYDASGNSIGWTIEDASSLNRFDANVGLNAFKRTVGEGVAPPGAVSAQLVIRKKNTLPGNGESQLLAMNPEFKALPVASSTHDRMTRYVYDAAGQLSRVTDALGYTESYTYDAFGNRTSLTNKNGQTWNYRYDGLGQLIEEITPSIRVSKVDAGGSRSDQSALLVTRNEYNAFGNITSRSEGRLRASLTADPGLDDLTQSRAAGYGYDALGRQVRITSPGWYNKATGQFQQSSDGTANTFQVTTDVTYDGLGNAVRNRVRMNNTGGASFDYVDSYKAYDLLGQVRYEVDALKGVTVHDYDGFGQETLTRRHAAALNAAVPASGYYQIGDFTAAALPRDGVNDRTLITRYDLLGRKTEVQQDIVSLYSFTGNVATSALTNVAPVKTFGYNSFGEITRETLLARDANGASVMTRISTVNYYDRAGQRIGTVDALGYYTRMEYTGSGKVSRQVEYANALGAWNELSIPTAQASSKDRSVRFAYDKADRVVQTTQENVTYWQQNLVPNGARATMTQVTGDVIVSRSTYDGVGNVRTLTDAAGNVTTTEYNALGQVQKVTEPERYSARAGSVNPFDNAVIAAPIVEYAVNAFGQVVYERRSAGTDQVGATQITRTVYDAAGHEVKEFDAMSSAQNFKVDVAGRRLEESREIYSELTGWRYNSQTLRRTFTYDSLGQQLGATDWYTDAGVQKSTSNTVVYNRFGEVTAELLNGNAKSSYLYNQIGNAIQQTNAQGVTQVDYDLTGKASRSAQLGNLSTSADDRITYLRNDLLGRVLEQHLPAFEANVSVDTLNSVSLALTTPIIRQASDRWGNVLSRTDARGYVTSYSYDHNNQVLSETLPETDILRENGTSYRASLIHEKRYDLRGLLVEEADLVSTGGGPLRSRQHVYNAAGQLVRDIDALGASRYYAVDAHGNRVGTYDPLGIATFDEYDAMDRHTAHGIVRNGQRVTLLTNQYDQAGRLYAEISGTAKVTETLSATEKTDKTSTVNGVAGNTRFTVFDERGNIVQTRTESNILKSSVFNEANRKVAEIDGLGGSLTWNYNEGDYGRLATHKDLGNRNFSYTYNAFGQMLTDNSDKSYAYYGNGLLKSVTVTVSGTQGIQEEFRYRTDEWRSVTTSSYLYDLAGNKVSETLASRITSTAPNANLFITSQETRYRFDEQGRLANAREFAGNMGLGAGVFTYNRIKVGKDSYMYSPTFHYGINTTADISLSYRFDEFGNRRQARMVTTSPSNINTVVDNWFKYDINDQAVIVDGFLENGAVVAGTQAGQAKGYTISYDAAGRRASSEQWSGKTATQENYERSEYIYNALGQVTSRSVRAITRQAGASSAGAVQSIGADQVNLSNSYDERGRIVIQATYQGGVAQTYVESAYRGDNQKLSELSYTYSNSLRKLSQATYFGEAGMLDAAGNQTRYRYVAYNTSGGITQSGDYRTTYSGYESYKASSLVATTSLSGYTAGTTGYVYTDRGDLLHLNTNGANGTRRFAYNGEGQIVGRWENIGVVQNYIYYQNAELANAGNASAPTIADTFSAISADYPGHAPSSYQVNQGDTFQSIAQSVWGDSRMWYLIADANGKDASSPLVAGTSLRIPNVVGSTHNDSTTFKPFNASEVIGNTVTAPQPPKPKKKKCNAVASIVMVVVAVVVSYFVPGLGGVFLGSLASQTAGKAMGVVDHISLKQAAVTTFTAGVASIAAPAISGATSGIANETVRTTINYAAQGAVVYASNYVGSKVVGLETSFSWKGMAASAIGSAVAGNLYSDDGLMGSVVRGQVSAHTSAWMRDKWFGGGRPDYGQVAADAFGNALADYMVGKFKASIESVNPKDFLDDKALRASNTTFAPGVASAEGSAVDAELVAKLRDLGWFDLSSSLTDEEYSGLKYSGPLDQKTPAWLSGAFNYLDRSKSADQALLTKKVEEATGFFGTSAAINTRVMNAIYYEFAEAGLAVVALGASQAVRDEVANKLGYVVNHPIEAVSTKAEKLWAEWNDTPATQVMEDTYRFGASTLLTLGVGKMAFSGVREAADAASSVLTRRLASRETLVEINRSDLGELLGRGGNKDVFAYGDSQAIGVLRVRDPQLLMDELKMLNQLEDLGLPTVNARGPISVSGQLGLMFDRFTQGSKSVVRLEESKVRIVGGSTLLNDQSIADLQGVRRVMVENNIQIDDLQFLISERGRVVIADPLGVNLNKPPSRNNLRMIDLLIKVAEGNKKL